MKILVAENSGVCFGVRRALNLLDESVKKANEEKRKIVMLGPLIHNPRVVENYSKLGVSVADISTIPENAVVVVRSHGVTLDVEHVLSKIEGLSVVDTTCPYVKRIHQLVEKKSTDGFSVIIMGDKDHSEVKGITSRVSGEFMITSPAITAEAEEELAEFVDKFKKIYAVAQTTSRPSNYEFMLKKIRKLTGNRKGIVFEAAQTICTATLRRQDSAGELASRVDTMVVVGGKNSSNTTKLFQVVQERNSNSFWVESPVDFSNKELEIIKKSMTVGITAGASTPDDQIEEMKHFLELVK